MRRWSGGPAGLRDRDCMAKGFRSWAISSRTDCRHAAILEADRFSSPAGSGEGYIGDWAAWRFSRLNADEERIVWRCSRARRLESGMSSSLGWACSCSMSFSSGMESGGDTGETRGAISGRDCRDKLRAAQGSKRLEVEDMRFRTMFSRTARRGGGPFQRGDGSSLGSLGVVTVNRGVDAQRIDVNPGSWVVKELEAARSIFTEAVESFRVKLGFALLRPCALVRVFDRGISGEGIDETFGC